jgi:formylglycine-generating enzyme
MWPSALALTANPKRVRSNPDEDMIWVPGGTFIMGSERHYLDEQPVHRASVEGFWMDKHTITNEQFSNFVDATNYVTVAERPPKREEYPDARPEMLQPASVVFVKPAHRVDLRNHHNWWVYMPGADWRHPEGPESSIVDRAKHPVVHIACEDAQAYADWAGKELPNEAEWEFAARGCFDGATYAWGEEFSPGGRYMANTWQGEFPWQKLLYDGYERTAPVGQFPPNDYGLFDMIGNVWEWTADWYAERHPIKSCCGGHVKPIEREQSYDPQLPNIKIPRRVIKGGSFLCAPNYCRRYRPAARMAQPIDTSTCHVGIRLIIRPHSS